MVLFLLSGIPAQTRAQFPGLPPAPDRLDSGALIEFVFGPNPFDLHAARENILFAGTATINRFPMPGYAHRVLPDGRHQIDTELISVARIGNSRLFGGEVSVRESLNRVSAGAVTELRANSDFPAQAYFDVFVDIATPLGTVHNIEPVRMEALIGNIPPQGFDETFRSTNGPVAVYDDSETHILGWIGGPFSPGGTAHVNFKSERCAASLSLFATTNACSFPPAGIETTPLHVKTGFVLGADPNDPRAPREKVSLRGSVSVLRGNPYTLSDGRVEVDTELLDIYLKGTSSLFGGDISFTRSLDLQSAGNLLALLDETRSEFPAINFFDVFFEINSPLGTLRNRQHEAMKIAGLVEAGPIFHANHHLLFDPVPIYDESGNVVAWVKKFETSVVPEPSTAALVGTGVSGLLFCGWRRRRRAENSESGQSVN